MYEKIPTVYILTNYTKTVLYVGVTSNLIQRIYQHKHELAEGFTKKYKVKQLVYYETCDAMEAAIVREKQLKKWRRSWKEQLIEKHNPEWKDLSLSLIM